MAEKTGLVLEGGGMRGLYTAGALDVMMEHGITFDGLMGVSAGGCIGASFASRQIGRSIRYYKKYAGDRRFMSWENWLRDGEFVGIEFSYHEIPEVLDPYDNEAFLKNPMEFYVVCTNVETGEAEYVRIRDMKKDIDYLRASATLPYVSHPVAVDGKLLMDGGCIDSIPWEQFRKMGFSRQVVITTRDAGYEKKAGAWWMPGMYYRKYPAFAKDLRLRFARYNRSLRKLEEEAEQGKLFLLQPSLPIRVGRTEGDPEKLQEAYDLGRFDAEQRIEEMKRFLAGAKETL
ncbi:MAG TPA: patatin family protein [Lachnoclostridium sp.]|nr:patatin family protein [Lachnoclostridium sp.]